MSCYLSGASSNVCEVSNGELAVFRDVPHEIRTMRPSLCSYQKIRQASHVQMFIIEHNRSLRPLPMETNGHTLQSARKILLL